MHVVVQTATVEGRPSSLESLCYVSATRMDLRISVRSIAMLTFLRVDEAEEGTGPVNGLRTALFERHYPNHEAAVGVAVIWPSQ